MSAGPRTQWGWHQLTDQWARRLVDDAGIRPGDLVLDVGAGKGALTAPLLSAGARVIAFELHPARATFLQDRFSPRGVKVIRADGRDLRLPTRPFHVVANPPFSITAALLRRLVSPNSRLVAAHLIVPQHVAVRWSSYRVSGAGRWSRSFDATLAASLPRSAFRPPPPGRTAVLRILRR